MNTIYEVLYYGAYKDTSGEICLKGEIWQVGYFTDEQKAKEAIQKDCKSNRLLLKQAQSDEVGDYHLFENNDLIGYYSISEIELNKITNNIICE